MKYIQLKYQGTGRRTVDIRTDGFMGPSRSPMGKGPLEVAGEYLRPGTLTTAFQLIIPPSNECQVVDCQHNREVLRRVTKSKTFFEDVKVFKEETGKYVVERQKLTRPPGFVVTDNTPIEEDIKVEIGLNDTPEVRVLKEQIAKLQGKEDKKDDVPSADATADGENTIEMEDEDPELTAEQMKEKRFENKVPDPVSLV